MIPGLSREPLKKIAPDPELLLRRLYRGRDEAIKAGRKSLGFRSGMKLAGTAFGWPDGCALAALMLT